MACSISWQVVRWFNKIVKKVIICCNTLLIEVYTQVKVQKILLSERGCTDNYYNLTDEVIFVIEKLVKKIANSQAFVQEDRLGQMIKQYETDELSEENLFFVAAAGKGSTSYSEFLRLAQERENKGI